MEPTYKTTKNNKTNYNKCKQHLANHTIMTTTATEPKKTKLENTHANKTNLEKTNPKEIFERKKLSITQNKTTEFKINTNEQTMTEPKPTQKQIKFEEKIINLKRICKTIKGGRKYRYSALVVVGNLGGKIGFACEKAIDAQEAVLKSNKKAMTHLSFIALSNKGLLFTPTHGKFNNSLVFIKNGNKGTGIKAGRTIKLVLELVGLKDASAKLIGSNNALNVVKATINALKTQTHIYKTWIYSWKL